MTTDQVYSSWELSKLRGLDQQNYVAAVEVANGRAKRLGVPFITRTGQPPAVGERRPSATALIEQMMKGAPEGFGGEAFRMLSAQAHATNYGLSFGIFEQVSTDQTDPTQRRLEVIQLYASFTMIAFLHSVSEELWYFGWDAPPWYEALHRTLGAVIG